MFEGIFLEDKNNNFIIELMNEISILLNSEPEDEKWKFKELETLENVLKTHSFSEEYLRVKEKYLADFKYFISSYNRGDDSFADEINNRAEKITIYLIKSGHKDGKSSEDKIQKIIDLDEKLSSLSCEQEELKKQNDAFLKIYAETNTIFEDLKSKNSAFSQLIDEQSNSQIGQLYRDIYNREIGIADQYRNWALGIFAIVGIILVLGFLNISIQNWNHLKDNSYIHIPLGWESLIKTLMLFSLTTPAWYLTRESSKHRKVAYKAQMLGTELASFPLYAREFKDEDRLELRKHLADRFFGQELYNDSKADSNSDNSLEQVKLLTEANKVLAESLKMKKSVESS